MQQASFHHLHPSHQYDALAMQQPTSNVVTLHPSTTILLSGPLASSNSSNYYPPPQPHYINSYPSPSQQQQPPAPYPTDKTVPAKDRHKRVR
jgi:hypothetical protein